MKRERTEQGTESTENRVEKNRRITKIESRK